MLKRIQSLLLITSLALLPACNKYKKHRVGHRARSSVKYIRRDIKLPKRSKYRRRLEAQPVEQQPYITVWIHGTTNNPVFKYFHSGPQGLHAAKDISHWYRMHGMAKQISKRSPETYPFEHFYIYSWSGNLSFSAREKAAADLYADLTALVKSFEQKYNQKPKLRLITHSHGGNVALNLARQATLDDLTINELILLACPVQQSTRNLVHHGMFEKIYSLYSFVDMMQVLDPQGLYPMEETKISEDEKKLFFSQREFPQSPKVRQAAIRLVGRSPGHAEFIFQPLSWAIPFITAELDTLPPQLTERVVINLNSW